MTTTRDVDPGLSRRAFLGRSALVTGGTVLTLTALGRLSARTARAASGAACAEEDTGRSSR
jgi:hypothetical protein